MSQSNREETYDSSYSHKSTQAKSSVFDIVKECCGIIMHGCSSSCIITNSSTPLHKALQRSGNIGRLETLYSILLKATDSCQSATMPSTSTRGTSLELTAGLVSGCQNLSIVEDDSTGGNNDEVVINEECEDSDLWYDNDDFNNDEEEEEEEDLEPVYGYRVDLVAQENERKRKPIYTHALLNDIKLSAAQVRKEFTLAPMRRELHHIDEYGLNQKSYRIWQTDNARNANFLQVEYLSRVEMHPDFQQRHGHHSDQVKALRKYNKDHTNDCINTPYTFIAFRRQYLNEHRSNDKMKEYWDALMHTKSLWKDSYSRRKLHEEFQMMAGNCAPITQIVCFGLGAINLKKNWYHSAIQYMAVFTIIQTLNEYYRRDDASRPSIKLVLQDPNYERKDHLLLQKLFGTNDSISFVSDPEGLLAIDEGTLAVTAFLPVQMPLVQIIADLFSKDPTKGPAAMICDIMTVDTEKREYSWSDRASPAAARFLTSHYEKLEDGFGDHGLDDELMADSYGDDWQEENRLYWLNMMDLWVRKT